MEKLFIPVILGTARQGRQSEKVANYVLKEAEKHGFETEIVDVRDHLRRATEISDPNAPTPWAETVRRAQGLIIVSPEYNNGYPGELKLLLDSLKQEYADKPIGIAGVSSGPVGGARMAIELEPVIVELGAHPIKPIVLFGKVGELFTEDGEITDARNADKLKLMFEKIEQFARSLEKPGRHENPVKEKEGEAGK